MIPTGPHLIRPLRLARLCLIAAVGLASAAAADPARQINLIADGNFEKLDHGPQDWTGFGPGAEVVEDPDQPVGHVLRLRAAEGGPAPAPVRATILAHAMARLLVSMRVRTEDLHGDAHAPDDAPAVALVVHGRGLNGEVPLAALTVTRAVDVNWTTLTTIVPVPAGVIILTVSANLTGTGTAWIDDVVLNADPGIPAQVIGSQIPAWLYADASAAGVIVDPGTGAGWLHLQPVTTSSAVTWASMGADWRRISVTLRLRGNGLILGAAARSVTPGATAPATAATVAAPAVMPVRAGVLVTWVDDHDRPLSATFDDLMMPVDGDWMTMAIHLDLPRPGALLRLQAVVDTGGSLDVDDVEVLPILSGD